MQALVEGAPKLIDYLGEASLKHFEGVQALLKDAGRPYRINPRLVRGLDYYNLTVFEWVTDQLGAQGTVCAGGRYDGLIEQLGGKPAPACGFAMGVERLLALWIDQGNAVERPVPDVYVVHQGEVAARHAFKVAEHLRDVGFSVQLHCGGGSFKSQMKRADGSGATVAAIIGDDEAQANEVTVKPLRDGGEQSRVAFDSLAETIGERILGPECE
jgi:histidyl-tRNA synthetase